MVIDVSLPFIVASFIAGIVMFLAPCTLPLVPAVLSFVSGISLEGGPNTFRTYRARVVLHTFFFIGGFSLVFILLGVLAVRISHSIDRELLIRIAGIILFGFGVLILGGKTPFFSRNFSPRLPSALMRPGKFSAFLLGAVFGLGWTPCAGPVVGTILTIAALEGGAKGVFLLTVFSLGLAVPFLAVAFFLGSIGTFLSIFSRPAKYLYLLSGILLIVFGMLLMTNNFNLLLRIGFSLFQFLDYQDFLFKFI